MVHTVVSRSVAGAQGIRARSFAWAGDVQDSLFPSFLCFAFMGSNP